MPTTSKLQVIIEHADHGMVARLIGDAAVNEVNELERSLRPIAASRGQLVIMDLAELRFISSLGLGMLVALHRGIVAGGGAMRLAAPQQLVRDVIVKCRFDSVLPVHASVNDAVAAHVAVTSAR